MANKKSASKPDAFSRLAKDIKDLTGLDIRFLKDKKVRMRLMKRSIPYVLFGYVGNLLGYSYRMSSAKDIIGKIMDTINSINEIVTDPMPSFHWQDLLSAVIVLSMMLSVITLIFYSVIMNVKEYKVINDMNQQQLIMQKEHYYKLREIDKETRKFRHDIQNHIIVLAKLLKEENLEQVKNYLQDISLHIENIKPIINCGSEIVDAILNEKYDRCKEKNISLNVKGIIHAPITIDDYDICTILANAVDNAIEACTRFKDGEKWITIFIGIHQNYINFIITNPISEEVNLRTKKKDKRNHGFGLQNLRECVLKNHGKVKISTENGKFILDILVKAF